MLSLSSLSLRATRPGQSGPGPQPGSVSIAGFSRDRTIFDSGAAFGLAAADVPLAGGGTAGQVVQARAISLDDGGAATTAWIDIATIDGSGQWTGSISAPRAATWFRPEVRLKSQPGVSAQGMDRFGVGHVIAIWGQSEPDRILSAFHDNTPPPAIPDAEAVQIFDGADTSPVRHLLSDAAPLTAAAAAMAATLIATRPGEKFALVFHTVSGSDPRMLVDDSNPGRSWAADKALHDFATADGQHVGLAAVSWFAASGGLGASYGEALFPLFSGKTIAGTPVSFPATITFGAGGSYHADHWFGELYDYARTRWIPYGPHRFDIDADMLNATHYLGGGMQFNLANKEAARGSWRTMLTIPDATMFLPLGLEPLNYVNGRDDGAGGWTDISHPSGETSDGLQAWARLTALTVLQSAGLTGWQVPEFDNCLWESAGAWVEVWSSAGPVTTTRLARGEPALGAAHAHWTDVMGFQINGQPAENMQIVSGRVRIFPNSGTFTHTDMVQFGEGGASGMISYPDDHIAGTWKNLPIVDIGAAGLDGVSVRPLADTAILANTLPVGAPSFHSSGTGPYFLDPQNVPANTTAITHAARIRFPDLPGSTAMLFSQSATGFDVELMNTGSLRVTVEDGTGLRTITSATVATPLAADVWYDIVCSADQTAKVFRVVINGALIATVPFSVPGNGVFQSNRALSYLARNSGTLQLAAEVEYLRTWLSATGNGAAPIGAPYKSITGPASSANNDPWKLGANAT
ncbi:MAG: LamG-like jellyroll fold domain-containing protein [Albidovulum sp.]|uniref:LamG-like jellyroll fold domain-containing protein n=1 Tax=Albidovulum sp. TaxID=1872424 RepID=UPI003C80174C